MNERPRLHPDLTWTELSDGAILERPDSPAYEAGALEAAICSLLDGERTLAEVRTQIERDFAVELPLEHLRPFLRQLAEAGLLDGGPDHPPRRTSGLARAVTWPLRLLARILVVFPGEIAARIWEFRGTSAPRRWHLVDPDRFLGWLHRRLTWCFTRTFLALGALVIGIGVFLLVTQWSSFWEASRLVWQPSSWLRLLLIGVLGVHAIHQLVHALVCVHFGGRVRSAGIRFILDVIPSIYVDISDARWFEHQRERLWTVSAGLLWQLFVLSAATIGWALTARWTEPNVLFLTAASTAFWGLVLNANPVIKRDLYYTLTGWLEAPRLRERARADLEAWAAWRVAPEALEPRERRWFRLYGVVSNVMGVAFLVLMGLFWSRLAEQLHAQAGLGLLLVSALFLQTRVTAAVARPFRAIEEHLGAIAKWALVAVLAAGGLWAMFLPYSYEVSGAVRIQPLARVEVRPEIEGTVLEVFVSEGEWVEAGQPLVRLGDRRHENNLQATLARLEEAQAGVRLLEAGPVEEDVTKATKAVETARAKLVWSAGRAQRYESLYQDELVSLQEYENALQVRDVDSKELEEAEAHLASVERASRPETIEAAVAEARSLEVLADSYRANVESTVVASPIAGQVVSPRVEELRGIYVKPGQKEAVVEIEDNHRVRVEILVAEEDVGSIAVGSPIRLVTWSYPDRMFDGAVVSIAPVAAPYSDVAISGSELAIGDTDVRVVRVLSEIDNGAGLLKSEMTGYAKVAAGHRPVWDVLSRPLIRWFRVEVWSWIP